MRASRRRAATDQDAAARDCDDVAGSRRRVEWRQGDEPPPGDPLDGNSPLVRHSLDGDLVMGTDGLFKYAASGDVAEILRGNAPRKAASQLLELVRLPSTKLQDDFAVVVARRRRAQVP
jgi:hypothetical protein